MAKIQEPSLPDELLSLIDLYSSFLTALSLHFAHNGTSAPVDLSMLLPSITKLYRVRNVTIDDVQLCLLLTEMNTLGVDFSLFDYGNGRVCMEFKGERPKRGPMGSPLPQESLQEAFIQKLDKIWKEWTETQEPPVCSSASPEKIAAFIAQLARSPILPSPSLRALSPLKRRGETLLADFNAKRPQTSLAKIPSQSTGRLDTSRAAPSKPKASTRGSSLLERIKAKEAAAAASPKKTLTASEIVRKSALSRAMEILDIVVLVAQEKRHGSSTASVSLSQLVQQVQQSVRMPIGEDEVRAVLDVLAEVAAEYLKVVKSQEMSYVTLSCWNRPKAEVLQERIEQEVRVLT